MAHADPGRINQSAAYSVNPPSQIDIFVNQEGFIKNSGHAAGLLESDLLNWKFNADSASVNFRIC